MTTTGEAQETRTEQQASAGRTAHLNLPGMSAEFHKPQLPSPNEMAHAAKAAPSLLPPTDKLLYYGGLGAAAVLGVIEWPVAIAVGAGIAIAQRSRHEGPMEQSRQESAMQRPGTDAGDLGDLRAQTGTGTPGGPTVQTGTGTPGGPMAQTGAGAADRTIQPEAGTPSERMTQTETSTPGDHPGMTQATEP
jgi:hypothetical protein